MLIWKGTVDNDFFNESNWQDDITLLPPSAGTINPGTAIATPLSITNTTKIIVANGTINLGTTTLIISNATLSGTAMTGGTVVTIGDKGYIDLSSATALTGLTQVNLTSPLAWLRTTSMKVSGASLAIFRVNGSAVTYQSNLRLDNYYLSGTVTRSRINTESPMTLYTGPNLTGTSLSLTVNTLHTSAGALSTVNDNIESFILRKGYMATVSNISDGSGKSRVYIASEEDLIVNTLNPMLQNTISFIRIVPWNWVTKKGTNGPTGYTVVNATWRYDWNNNTVPTIELDYVPMSWGNGGTVPAEITSLINRYGANHILGFNEPDNVGQSGGFAGLTDPATALTYADELQKAGIRVISPGCTEDQAFIYLKNFRDLARTSNVRIDVIAVHWSDWSAYYTGTTAITGAQILDRFKIYLGKVYNMFGLPIWITEFNANPNRAMSVHLEFMQVALPYLETLEYVERYNWFESANNNSELYVGGNPGVPTSLGTFYASHVSTPSIPEKVVNERNSLNLKF